MKCDRDLCAPDSRAAGGGTEPWRKEVPDSRRDSTKLVIVRGASSWSRKGGAKGHLRWRRPRQPRPKFPTMDSSTFRSISINRPPQIALSLQRKRTKAMLARMTSRTLDNPHLEAQVSPETSQAPALSFIPWPSPSSALPGEILPVVMVRTEAPRNPSPTSATGSEEGIRQTAAAARRGRGVRDGLGDIAAPPSRSRGTCARHTLRVIHCSDLHLMYRGEY